jgi:hypothetical protein
MSGAVEGGDGSSVDVTTPLADKDQQQQEHKSFSVSNFWNERYAKVRRDDHCNST